MKMKDSKKLENGKRSKVMLVVNVVRTEHNILDGFILRFQTSCSKKNVVHLIEITEHVALENNAAQTNPKNTDEKKQGHKKQPLKRPHNEPLQDERTAGG